jgi:hypothetical protein
LGSASRMGDLALRGSLRSHLRVRSPEKPSSS